MFANVTLFANDEVPVTVKLLFTLVGPPIVKTLSGVDVPIPTLPLPASTKSVPPLKFALPEIVCNVPLRVALPVRVEVPVTDIVFENVAAPV